MKAKKSYGQHFLNSAAIAERISKIPDYKAGGNILEVGPGKGALTKYLLDKGDNLKLVEADRDMVSYLLEHRELRLLPSHIIQSDFLKMNLSKVFDGRSFTLIGNYPYNISSQIIFQMIKYREYIPEMVGMFQKEVADRIVSKEGSKVYGTLSVMTQVYYTAEVKISVSPDNFSPSPKVDSAVIHCKRRKKPLYNGPFPYLQTIVRSIFGKRRKMVRNSLKSVFSKEKLENLPYLELRPEQMPIKYFVELAEMLRAEEESL